MTSEHPGRHVFQQTRTIFIHIQDIIKTNILTKKMPLPPGGHAFQATETIFKLVQYIIVTNFLTRLHDDRTINVASRVKNATPPWRPCFSTNLNHFHTQPRNHWDRTINVATREKCPALWQPCFSNVTIFELIQDIIEPNLLTQFREDWTINGYRVLTRKNAWPPAGHTINVACIVKNASPPGCHVFQPTGIIFELVQLIIEMNLFTKVLTRKNAPPLGSHVFQKKHLIETNLLIKFPEDWTINVAFRVKNAPPPGGHVFQSTGIIFHTHWTTNVASGVLTSHVFQANVTIFELIPNIIESNLLIKFHEDWAVNVASRMLTRRNAPPLGSHVFQTNLTILELIQDIRETNLLTKIKCLATWQPCFQANVTIFKLIQDIIEANLLTKFHEDWTIDVASRVLTRQVLTPHNGRRTTDKRRSQKLPMSTTCI
ncbi:hypothetical protein DPMN_009356 [Dreissena polymorpha]|uniref:Uncharacterized protein n=1 Tax=Dreissena polymorpha TaxID=45954 RepID=A0A9D4MWU5_DREPO|nr:hypothetical protein DPMN_009356 [Dreissena polymorpha]